jgi:tagatose-6-phosphate ketose/aldose isomerase
MNELEKLLSSPQPSSTIREIAQQPAIWKKTAQLMLRCRDRLASFLSAPGSLFLTGAGSSEFVGRSIEGALRSNLRREVNTFPTTHLVTHSQSVFLPGKDYLLVSFARSGNSPESVTTFQRTFEQFGRVGQAVITCDQSGKLAQAATALPGVLCIVLPSEANDKALAMTSSFSSMVLAGLSMGLTDTPEKLISAAERAARGAQRIIGHYGDALFRFATKHFSRACFLGSDTRLGCMQEGHLKMLEMSAGRVSTIFDSFLGLRHGPQVFINGECLVVASLSSGLEVSRYELDLLREIKTKKQGCATLVICAEADTEIRNVADEVIELYPGEEPLQDDFRVLTDVVVCQILAYLKSLSLGLSPDNPSPEGIINRVVQGIKIYPR